MWQQKNQEGYNLDVQMSTYRTGKTGQLKSNLETDVKIVAGATAQKLESATWYFPKSENQDNFKICKNPKNGGL